MKFIKAETKEEVSRFIIAWEIAFDRALDQSIYDWIFSSNNNIYCCVDNGIVVSGYCLLDMNISIDGILLDGVLCNNIFVNGFKYQKMDIFNKITKHALNNIFERGYRFSIGFPNVKAIKSHIKAGWRQSERLPFVEFSGSAPILVENDVNLKWIAGDKRKAYKEISDLINKSCKNFSFSILKSQDFMLCRFDHNPRWEYEIGCLYKDNVLEGFFVSKYFEDKNRIHLVDYYFSDTESLKQAITGIYKKYKSDYKLHVNCVDAWCAKGDLDKFLNANFTLSDDFSYVIYKDLSGGELNLGFNPHLTLADNDVF